MVQRASIQGSCRPVEWMAAGAGHPGSLIHNMRLVQYPASRHQAESDYATDVLQNPF